MNHQAKWLLLLVSALIVIPVSAGTLHVRVVDQDGVPAQGVAVFAIYDGSDVAATASAKSAVMDQVDTQFVPHMLLVPKGTSVEFPNSDVVAHHVYSFSKPNDFVLSLYKGVAHKPVTFSNDGVVIIGCNIHDEMLAYIVVVDTDVHAITNESGEASLLISDAAADVEIKIWSPRIRDDEQLLAQKVSSNESQSVEFALRKSLRPSWKDQTESIEWSNY